MEVSNVNAKCKICGSPLLKIFSHTAKCQECSILLYYPYPKSNIDLVKSGEIKPWSRDSALPWYSQSSFYNHENFSNMVKFAVDESFKGKELTVLDYGGGGGQFALIFKSLFPQSKVYITDLSDDALLDEWKSCNEQIPFNSFDSDDTKFDFIFMCDVLEHINEPAPIVAKLSSKLKDNGRLFIDTPKQFWIYPVSKVISKKLYTKILKGTVSEAHLQIWSKQSFDLIVNEAGLKVHKYSEVSEYTMPADFYMDNMNINSGLLRIIGGIFYKISKLIAKNKIMCVLSKPLEN